MTINEANGNAEPAVDMTATENTPYQTPAQARYEAVANRRLPDEKPCQCHQSFAYVAPFHQGHCCFWPPTRDCHQAEVTEWERRRGLVAQ